MHIISFLKNIVVILDIRVKKSNYNSYTTNYTNNNIVVDYDNNKIKLPKLGIVKAKLHRNLDGKIKNTTISRMCSGKYFISITYESTNNRVLPITNKSIGIDLGIKNLVITSDGVKYEDYHTLKNNISSPKYVILGNKYVVFTSMNLVSDLLSYGEVFISANDAYAINGEGIITERKVFIVKKNDKWYVYKNSNINNEDNIIKVYDNKDSNGNVLDLNKISEIVREDFKDYNYVFKHTFKKNKTGYYYYSTEMEEIK